MRQLTTILCLLTLSLTTMGQSPYAMTNMARDFWVMFLSNTGGTHQTALDSCTIIVTGPEAAEVTIVSSTESATFHLAAGSSTEYLCGTNAEVAGKAWHVTSTADIALFARNAVQTSHDVATIIPSFCLGTEYIAQSVTAVQGDMEMLGFVATEDSTLITVDFHNYLGQRQVPSDIDVPADGRLHIPLQRGEGYILFTQTTVPDVTHGWFGGKTVTSNGRPFAMFQGNSAAHIPTTDTYNGGHLYEQAVPISQWGHLCIAGGGFSELDLYYADVYSAGDNELILHVGDTDQLTGWMSRGEIDHYEMVSSSFSSRVPRVYYYTQGASCYLQLCSYGASGFCGAPSSAVLPTLDHGVREAWFTAQEFDPYQVNHLIIYCDTAVAATLRLDGQLLSLTSDFPASMQPQLYPIHPYHTTVDNGVHHLKVDSGAFIAFLYGTRSGYNDSYANSVGMALDPYPRDTLYRTDTVCAFTPYDWGPFHYADGELTDTGTFLLVKDVFDPDTMHRYYLTLIVLPAYRHERHYTMVPGETLIIEDTVITSTGTYIFRYTTADGCDSTLTVTVELCTAPIPCVTLSRPFFDFDHPVVVFTDCTDGEHCTLWRFGDGITLTSTTVRRQLHQPMPDSLDVQLTVCDTVGCCTDTLFSVPVAIRSVWFPNAFTPDEDDNNRFLCFTSVNVVEFELHIYNRWGLLVYSTDDPTAQWDGTRNGQPLPQGTYVYYWRVRDDSDYHQSGTGTVTLLR